MTASRNIATPEGRILGAKLAEWCDNAEPKARLQVPEIPPRCASCAFRAGDHHPNGSPLTQMDALKAVIEQVPFYCHEPARKDWLCSGWLMMQLAHADGRAGKVPWPFSDEAEGG